MADNESADRLAEIRDLDAIRADIAVCTRRGAYFREREAAGARLLADLPKLLSELDARDKRIAELEAELDAAQLLSIEARNPGIDMEDVKRIRRGGV